MNTEAIASKVQKLLALADSANEHEAALAATRANDLLVKYNLSLEDLPSFSRPQVGHDILFTKSSSPWVRQLWKAVCKLNFCGYAYSLTAPAHLAADHPKQNRTFHYVIGSQANVASATVMAEYLTDTVIRLSAEQRRLNNESGRWQDAFRDGAATTVARRLKEKYEANHNAATAVKSNLPVVMDQAEAENTDYMKNELRTTTSVARKRYINEAAGYSAGQSAGSDIGLNSQISATSSTRTIQ